MFDARVAMQLLLLLSLSTPTDSRVGQASQRPVRQPLTVT